MSCAEAQNLPPEISRTDAVDTKHLFAKLKQSMKHYLMCGSCYTESLKTKFWLVYLFSYEWFSVWEAEGQWRERLALDDKKKLECAIQRVLMLCWVIITCTKTPFYEKCFFFYLVLLITSECFHCQKMNSQHWTFGYLSSVQVAQ